MNHRNEKAIPRVLLQARLGGLTTALLRVRRDGKERFTMKPNPFNRFFQREEAANSATADVRETAIANALDPSEAIDFSEDAAGWFKISPYGTFRGKTPGRPQSVSQENARAMDVFLRLEISNRR